MHTKAQQYFLLFMIAIVGVLSFFVISPFLTALALAMVAAVVFYPVYDWVLKKTKNKKNIASFLTIIIIAIIIILPIAYIGTQLVQEASALYGSMLVSGDNNIFTQWLARYSQDIAEYFPGFENVSLNISGYTQKGLSLLLANALPIFSNLASLFLNTFIFLTALFYLFRDGDKFVDALVKYSPLRDADDRSILATLRHAINSVVTGSLFIAVIQGFIATIGFSIFGIPHAILFGSLATIAALLPGVGTALVLTPAILYLFAISSTTAAVGLLIWGMVAVGLVDNILGPHLMGRGVSIPPLAMFVSVIGGLAFFGPFGFIFGPLVLSLLFTLITFFFEKKI